MSAQSKPLGVTLIALYSGLFGLASFPIGCTGILVSGAPGAGAQFSIVSFLVTAVGILLITSAYGLWTIQPWGRSYSWWLYVISIPLGALSIFGVLPGQRMSEGNTIYQLVGMAVDFIIIWYLSNPALVAIFEQESQESGLAEFSRREPL